MLTMLLLAAFLLGHGLIHASFLTPRPAPTAGAPSWPFDLERSWLLGRMNIPTPTTRALGTALVALTIAGFALAAIVALGVLDDLWVPAVTIGALASLAVLGLFYRPWLTLGLVIDLVLLWVVLVAGFVPSA
jgi:hypothetical protein